MIARRANIVFSTGFLFGMIVVGTANYATFLYPSWSRNAAGSFVAHDPSYSGFPFSMYAHAYLSSSFICNGAEGNLICGLALCFAVGWSATKVAARNGRLK
jgi:hypothetical protein